MAIRSVRLLMANLPPRRIHYHTHPAGTKIKQADVILMGYPWEFQHENFTAQTRANDLAVYGPVTDPGGPAMTWVRTRLIEEAVYEPLHAPPS